MRDPPIRVKRRERSAESAGYRENKLRFFFDEGGYIYDLNRVSNVRRVVNFSHVRKNILGWTFFFFFINSERGSKKWELNGNLFRLLQF